MTDYINLWLDIIENMNNDNTYKLAWGRALIEIIYEHKEEDCELVIPFVAIAENAQILLEPDVFFQSETKSGKEAGRRAGNGKMYRVCQE